MKLVSAILLVCLIRGNAAVKVSVFYETLCPDSIAFIKDQLYPTWVQLTQEYLEVDFVPYGKATQYQDSQGNWTFSCQHGAAECAGNMDEACALSVLSNNATALVQYISCVMSTRNPPQAGSQCATVLGIDYTPILNCKNSGEGWNLLALYGDRTHAFSPPIMFVPTVAFNGVYNQTDQDDSLTNLLQVVCRHVEGQKPTVCYN